MIFALGFLAATLLALLVIPALNARADRLAKRRAEALFPMSVEELTAEKDHLRAEFAVVQRRLERRLEEVEAARAAEMEEVGRRVLRIEGLEGTLLQRDQRIAALEGHLEEAGRRAVETEAELGASQTSLATTREALAALERAHRGTLEELAQTRQNLAASGAALEQARADLERTRERLMSRDAEYADLLSRHSAALGEIDARRITISDLETRLATQTSRGDDYERALGERRMELSSERQRLADLAKGLVAEQERALALEQRIRSLEADRDARAAQATRASADLSELRTSRTKILTSLDERTAALHHAQEALVAAQTRMADFARKGGAEGAARATELRALTERLEIQRAERAALEGALAAARDERARLERALAQQRREAELGNERIQAENAELRRRIDAVADDILRVTEPGAEPRAEAASERAARTRRARRPAATA